VERPSLAHHLEVGGGIDAAAIEIDTELEGQLGYRL